MLNESEMKMSDILIKNIEMPTEEQSVITINIYSDAIVTCFDDDVEREAIPVPPHMDVAIEKVIFERTRQMKLWGECSDNHPFEWMSILGEEFGELCEAVNETYFKNGIHPECGGNEKIIKEAVHVAAVAVAIIESSVRNAASTIISAEEVNK